MISDIAVFYRLKRYARHIRGKTSTLAHGVAHRVAQQVVGTVWD